MWALSRIDSELLGGNLLEDLLRVVIIPLRWSLKDNLVVGIGTAEESSMRICFQVDLDSRRSQQIDGKLKTARLFI